ncbi:methionine/alanine import family NSS transporter small subunit [Acinetobacter sp. NIPH 2699]|nr:methionine/alanine import family NSS transporter small subunit [Acinetobacter sp. NIPH 2699]MCH7335601.1 methionine/alanine import family NSS transporter small subunit [Acinetobacter sp. NIPH 2699]
MNTSAIIMMVISIVLLWGGLTLAVLHLMRHPEQVDDK